MKTTDNKSKRQDQQSYLNGDFVPPEPSYLEHEPFNSAFFKDHCQEEYQIQRAFRADNFTYLRSKIPNKLKYGAILEQRLLKVQQNTELESAIRGRTKAEKEDDRNDKIARKKMEQIGQLGYFQVFPYQQSLYGVENEIEIRQKQRSKRKQQMISPLDFRPSGFDKKLKYQNPFTYVDRLQDPRNVAKSQYIYPFHIPEDTYDRFHESELRTRIIQQAGKIAGDFIPAGQDKSLTKISKSKASEIIRQLEVYIKKYLPKIGFFIGLSKKDHFDLLFEAQFSEDQKLTILMSRICESQLLSKYLLRRNPIKWGRIGETGYLQYSLLPPWVKDVEQKLTRQ